MDIANYIGLFLLKNHFCYVHGLGNMELHKRPAIHDGNALQAPSYEVLVTPGGSIDDNLANFIATNEQISISKAANALRDFSIQARKDMALGNEVAIPNIGKFVEFNDKVKFITDDNFRFTPAGIPTIRNSKQLEEQNAKLTHKPSYPTPTRADSVNWSMVILLAVLLIILGGGIFGIWYYMRENSANAIAAQAEKDTLAKAQQMTVVDTTHINDSSMVAAMTLPPDSMQVITYKMIIGNYPNKERADRRQRNLSMNGSHIEMVQADSTDFLILTYVNCQAVDTNHVKDSLIRLFGYKDVMTYK